MYKMLILLLIILPINLLGVNIEIIADVNGEPISSLDVEKYVNLMNSLFQIKSGKEQKLQILMQLVDEIIIVNEAQRLNVKLSGEELSDAVISFLTQSFNIRDDEVNQYVKEHNIDLKTLKKQIKCQLLWGKIVEIRIVPFIKISDKEVKEAKEQIEKPDYLITFQEFMVPSQENGSVYSVAEDLAKELRDSDSNFTPEPPIKMNKVTVNLSQLKYNLKTALEGIENGNIAGPVSLREGYYSIVKVIDKVQINNSLLESTLKVKEVIVKSSKSSLEALKEQKINCFNFDKLADNLGLPSPKEFEIKMQDLNPNLQALFIKMGVNKIIELKENCTSRLMILCDIKSNKEDTEAIKQQIFREKIMIQSNLLLNNMRKNVSVSYRYS